MGKKKGKHAPFVIPFYGCFHLHGEGVEMREQMSILLLVPTTRDTYTEWRLREREREKKGKKDSKGFGHDFSERFYDSLLVCQLSGDIDCYHGRVESRT